MNKIYFVLALALFPLSGRAQVVTNMPEAPETATLTFRFFTPEAKQKGHFFGQLETLDDDNNDYAILECADAKMKAHPVVNGVGMGGYFDFESSAVCDSIAQAVDGHPNQAVRFTLTLNSAKRDQVPGYFGGEVTKVEWLK